jgi:predicted outer membrane repeat protein
MTNCAARISLLAVTALLFGAGIAKADPPGPVKACVSDTQVGAGLNLAQALAAGGVIRFDCQAGSTIRVTGRYVLKVSTLIDGGDAVTLDGHGTFGPMLSSSKNIILRRLTLRGFAQKPPAPPGPGGRVKTIGRITGSVLAASGDVELDHANIETSDFPIDVRGTATVKDSAFVGNRGGLTLAVGGVAHIENCRFTGNSHELSISAGWVRRCSFNGQTGSALSVRPATGPVEIRHSTFSGIRGGSALMLSQRSGPSGSQTITVRANVFRDNDGGSSAGAIALFDVVREARDRGQPVSVVNALSALPPAAFVLSYNRFTGNRGGRGGAIAADLAHTLGMVSTGDLFTGNTADGDGGAVAASGGALRISHALFKSNRAGGRGAALTVTPDGSASISNTLVINNAGPTGVIAGNAVTLTNVTVADNLAVGLIVSTSTARVGNILLAHNRPADCAGVPAGAFRGGGLQSDGSCPGVAVGDAFLDPFYVPAANSPALSAGDPSLCRGALVGGVDLPFQARQNPTNCALGAFERPPLRKFSSKTEQRPVHTNPEDEFSDYDPYQPPPMPDTQTRPTSPPGSRTDQTASTDPTATLRAPETSPQGSADAAPMNSVLAALKAEEASPIERVRVFITRGNIADEYYIDRVSPGRFRMLVNPRQGGPERIIVDKMQWARVDVSAPWLKTPIQESPGSFPSMADLFRNGLSRAVEKAGPAGSRSVEGAITWTNGTLCEGKVLLRIDAAGLPLLLRFEGLCGNKPLRFREVFSYTGPVTITAPE